MNLKPILIVSYWFGTSFITLILSLFLLIYISTDKVIEPKSDNFQLYAALPNTGAESVDSVSFEDARAKIIENFFKGYNSILANHSQTFITVADKYNLDYRLLPAISMQESNGGKRVIKESYNPFGYGIYGDKVTRFESWDAAIERVGRGLKEDYLDKGLTNPEEIMAKYTPPSLKIGGVWAKGVNTFMAELQ